MHNFPYSGHHTIKYISYPWRLNTECISLCFGVLLICVSVNVVMVALLLCSQIGIWSLSDYKVVCNWMYHYRQIYKIYWIRIFLFNYQHSIIIMGCFVLSSIDSWSSFMKCLHINMTLVNVILLCNSSMLNVGNIFNISFYYINVCLDNWQIVLYNMVY